MSSIATIPPIPSETARTAKAVFGGGNFYILVGEQMDRMLGETGLQHLSEIGKSLQTPAAVLPVVTFFQFIEGLTDEQVADAFRVRVDWKFALHLPVNVPIFSELALCKFRHKVMTNPESQAEFQRLVDRMIALNPPGAHAQEDYQVLAQLSTICSRNCRARVKQAMSQAIEALAVNFPAELQRIALPDWYGRYNRLMYGSRANSASHEQEFSVERIGKDIEHLLAEVDKSEMPKLQKLREIAALRQVWQRRNETHRPEWEEHSTELKPFACNSCVYRMGGEKGANI